MPRRIAFINEKGGSGKTTLVTNLACYLALRRGRRTLAIDMDPQGQLGKALGIEVRHARHSSLELLLDAVLGEGSRRARPDPHRSLPISETRIPGLDVVVANKSLALFPTWTFDDAESDPTHRLADSLKLASELDDYDFLLFDAPPSFGPLTLNVLLACDEVVVPVPLTYLALDGCAELTRTIAMVRERYSHGNLRITMVIPTFYRRTRLANEILDTLKTRFPKEIAHTTVGFHVKIDEAQSHGLSVFEYAPHDRGAKTLAALAEELDARGVPDPTPPPPSEPHELAGTAR